MHYKEFRVSFFLTVVKFYTEIYLTISLLMFRTGTNNELNGTEPRWRIYTYILFYMCFILSLSVELSAFKIK